jgi:hypothetical protein
MQYPDYAVLYLHFGEIQLARDIAVIETLAQQAIDRDRDTPLLPEAVNFMSLCRKNRQAEPPCFKFFHALIETVRWFCLPLAQTPEERGNARLWHHDRSDARSLLTSRVHQTDGAA